MKIAIELQYYHARVNEHYEEYLNTQKIWIKLQKYLVENSAQEDKIEIH